jgi:type VI secretion system protein ImpK
VVAQPRTLGRIAGDFFNTILLFQQSPEANYSSPSALRSQMLGLLDGVLRDPDTKSLPPADLEEARFALVAWADEMVLKSSWSGRDDWQREPLQVQLFRTNKAGNEFYDHLAQLRPDQTAAREIYFLCLLLGFEGQYMGHEGDRRAIVQQQYDLLRVAGRALELGREEWLAPPAYDTAIRLAPGRRARMWPAVLAILLGTAGVFGAFWWLLRAAAERVPLPPLS